MHARTSGPAATAESATKRRRVFRVWGLIVLLGLACTIPLFGRLSNGSVAAGSQAQQVQSLLNRYGPNGGTAVVVVDNAPVNRPGLAQQVRNAEHHIATTPGVTSVVSCYDARATCGVGSPLRGSDGTASLIVVSFARSLPGAGQFSPPPARLTTLNKVYADAHTITEARILVGGNDYFGLEVTSLAESNLVHGEVLGLLAALIVLLLLFGLRAALIPLLAALGTFGGAFLLLFVLTFFTPVDVYAVNIVTMLGLGLSLDYALLLVVRYRQEKGSGADHPSALAAAAKRAGHAVTFSGLTVMVCLSVLVVFRDTPFTSIALGGIAATAAAIVGARTLVPALLGSFGPRLRLPRSARPGEGFARLARGVQRRPIIVSLAGIAVLMLLASPSLHIHLVETGVESLPASAQARAAVTTVDTQFPAEGTAEVDIVAGVSPGSPGAVRLATDVAALPGVRNVTASDLGGRTLLTAQADGASNGAAALAVVTQVRGLTLPYGVLVGGDAAFQLDHGHQIAGHLPLGIALLVLLTGLLIGYLTRSWVLAIIAPALAALSQGAMLGALVWAYQSGHLNGLLPMASTGGIIVYVPIVAFALAYALSLDYLVFLLSRMKEEQERGDPQMAMVEALRHTGQVITVAAGLIALVFLGFASGSLLLVQQLGFALAFCVLVDATLVRCVLLPALVSLANRQRRLAWQADVTALPATPGTLPETLLPVLTTPHTG